MQQFSATKVRLAFASLAVLFSLPHMARADSITVTSTGFPTTTFSSGGDTGSLNDGSVTVDPTTGPFVFQTGDFIIGNGTTPDQVVPFTFQDSITIDGITQDLTFSGQYAVTDTAHTLTVFEGSPVQFGNETFTLMSSSISGTAPGQDVPVDLQASVTPEPGTFVLLGTGLLGIAFITSKRRFVSRV